VVPVRDGRAYLAESLPALLAQLGEHLLEVLVVDDGSRDGSAELANELGAQVLRSERSSGPAAARNRGAEAARGEVLFFVDADVVVHPDAVDQVARAMAAGGVVAVFGSYDDRPRDPGFASRYMNLRHHHVHQSAARETASFWAGCGAVRTSAFRQLGGFDAQRFAVPSIEDIALGRRLHEGGGRILLLPDLQGTHLKRWTLWSAIHTDVFRRALPWGRLIVGEGAPGTELNTSPGERLCAVVAWGVAAAALLWAAGVLSFAAVAAALALAALLNRRLLALFARRGGWWFALRGLIQHQLYYLYASAVYVFCLAERRLRRRS
jgi:glycosyltransferase involved in cell wall biosynthesis